MHASIELDSEVMYDTTLYIIIHNNMHVHSKNKGVRGCLYTGLGSTPPGCSAFVAIETSDLKVTITPFNTQVQILNSLPNTLAFTV